jgi:thioredoxin 2
MNGRANARLARCENCGRRNRLPAAAPGVPRCGNCHRPLPWIADAGDDDFAEIAEGAEIPVLADMWAPWCGPCRMVSPALERIARSMAGRLKLVKVNVDDAPKLQQRFNVHAVPTLMVMRGSRVIAHQPGALPESALRSWVEQALSTADRASRTADAR